MRPQKRSEPPAPSLDEGWWAAVLADENRRNLPGVERSRAAPASQSIAPGKSESATPDWSRATEIFRSDEIVHLKVTGHNRGGLLVGGDGLSGFVPCSHLVQPTDRPAVPSSAELLKGYLGTTLQLKVIECVPEEGRIVFSERAALAEPGRRTTLFRQMRAGQVVEGTVTNTTDFGVFVDLGGVEGLIHISELSWGRVLHPNHVVRVGQTVRVQVLDLSAERCRIALSLKRLEPNPWERASDEFPVGTVLPATVTSVLSYGAFARLEAGVEGLVHVSEMPMPAGKSIREFLATGQQITVRVLHLDPDRQRMGLRMLPAPGTAPSG